MVILSKWDERIKKTTDRLDSVSPSFCMAKWLQVTIHLQNGFTHSCHHPGAHKIPLEELEENPSALHNTKFKKELRKEMLEGKRPEECDYCWKVEDASENAVSDRHMKSADNWAFYHFDEVLSKPWDYNINPKYLEVSFGNECNFRCAYCSPDISSAIWAEFEQKGPFQTSMPQHDLGYLESVGRRPFKRDEVNPYVEAFWKWFPQAAKDIKVFRITGGEPLINQNTFRVLDYIDKNPNPNMELAINSNLNVPDRNLNKFLDMINKLMKEKKIKNFTLFTSVDTVGKQAEFIRNGMDYDRLWKNMYRYINEVPSHDAMMSMMVTFNILSIPKFKELLKQFNDFRSDIHFKGAEKDRPARFTRVYFDTAYLRNPLYMCTNILDQNLFKMVEESLAFMKANPIDDDVATGFFEWEVEKLERVVNWLYQHIHDPTDEILYNRGDFYLFIKDYEKRRGVNFLETFPEMAEFFENAKQCADRLILEKAT